MMKRATTTSTMSIHSEPEIHVAFSRVISAPRRQIAMKSSATSEAPPIKPPSTSGFANRSRAFPGLDAAPVENRQIPRQPLIPRADPRADECVHVLSCCGVAFLPVPIAHTGS